MGLWRAKGAGLRRPEGAGAGRVVVSAVGVTVLSSGACQGAGGQSPGRHPRPQPPSGELNLGVAGPIPLWKGDVSWTW